MSYVVAVLPDRIQAEAAYSALEKEGLPMAQTTILGKGYASADQFGLINPDTQADRSSKRLLYLLVPFGFVAGYAFNLLGVDVFTWASEPINHIIGGILGAASGALGAFFVGGTAGRAVGSGDALAYRNRLNQGKYLVVFQGNENLISQATRILRSFEPENIQGYTEPS